MFYAGLWQSPLFPTRGARSQLLTTTANPTHLMEKIATLLCLILCLHDVKVEGKDLKEK